MQIRYGEIRNQCRFQCESALVKLVLFSLVTPFGKKQFACTCPLIVLQQYVCLFMCFVVMFAVILLVGLFVCLCLTSLTLPEIHRKSNTGNHSGKVNIEKFFVIM